MLYLKYELPRLSLELNLENFGITALFGHSGAGKTSILRIIAGLEPTYKGNLKFGAQVWQDQKIFVPPYQRKIGYVFQDTQLFNHLSVTANLVYAASRSGMTHNEMQKVCEQLHIEQIMSRMPDKLSGGEKQRVAFARCLCSKPQLLLLDEPFTALEDDLTQLMLEYLAKLKLPTIYVSHSLNEIIQVADYLIHIEQGKMLRHGNLNAMLQFIGRNRFTLKVTNQ